MDNDIIDISLDFENLDNGGGSWNNQKNDQKLAMPKAVRPLHVLEENSGEHQKFLMSSLYQNSFPKMWNLESIRLHSNQTHRGCQLALNHALTQDSLN
jgi:hypothetical protein